MAKGGPWLNRMYIRLMKSRNFLSATQIYQVMTEEQTPARMADSTHAPTENGLRKEVILILLGAIVSGISVFSANFLNFYQADREKEYNQKLEFIQGFNDVIAERLFLTNQVIEALEEKNQLDFAQYANQLENNEVAWERSVDFTKAFLRNFYSSKFEERYVEEIYLPLDKLGRQLEGFPGEAPPVSEMASQYRTTQEDFTDFMTDLFDKL